MLYLHLIAALRVAGRGSVSAYIQVEEEKHAWKGNCSELFAVKPAYEAPIS
jgi:hypothetical protein